MRYWLLGANFFLNSNAVFQENVLLHELLHAYTGGTDGSIFATFSKDGLAAPSTPGDTQNITAWLSTDYKSTPTSMTWWQ
jgi:hypothetical protein